jgi:hypothetical protein
MSNISTMFAAGIEQVRRSWGWFLVTGIVLMVLGIACISKAQTATTFSILALGWVLAISGVFWLISSFPGLDLGRILCIPAKRNPPLRDRVPSNQPPRRRSRRRHDGAGGTVYRGRSVPRGRGERHSVPAMGMDGFFSTGFCRAGRLSLGHLAHSRHLLYRHCDRRRPHF